MILEAELPAVRDYLLKELESRRPAITTLYRYYRGEHPLPDAPKEVRDAYLAFLRQSRTNFCRLIVKATAERLRVTGLRSSTSKTDAERDVAAWRRYWQANALDRDSRLVHDAALIARRGFTMVWPNEVEGAPPSITAEHPSQCIVAYEAGNKTKRAAGLKTFVDIVAQRRYCTVWTPELVANYVAPWKSSTPGTGGKIEWEPWVDLELGIMPLDANPLEAVALVEFVNDPDLILEPMGELDGGIIDVQDRINKQVLDRMVASNFAAFKQKWATGLALTQNPDGTDAEPYRMAVDSLLVAEDPLVKFGEFSETDLTGYISGAEADIEYMASMSRTPANYLLGKLGRVDSADGIKATENALVSKCGERRDSFTESWETTIRLAMKLDGDDRADDYALAMLWKDTETRTMAEMIDAAVKMVAIGVPWAEVMAFIGYSPTDIVRLDTMRADDAANGLLAAPAMALAQQMPPAGTATRPPSTPRPPA